MGFLGRFEPVQPNDSQLPLRVRLSDPNYITLNGLERIQRELLWLEKVERPRVVAEVAYAASLGDRSENAEYIYGKKRLRKIDGRRRYLIKRLEVARPIDISLISGTAIRFGAKVVLEDEEGEQQTWRLYGEDEVDISAGILSWKSPIGRALMGREEGDVAMFQAPGGKREVEIVRVVYEAQEPLPDELEFSSL